MTVDLLRLLVVASIAIASTAGAQRAPFDVPPHADTTGESDVYPVGDAVGVYHAILDMLYVDGKEKAGVIVLWDTAQRQAGGPCSWKCVKPWPHQSKIDTATILAYTQQSWKRPRIADFGYRKIPIVLVSNDAMERITQDGYAHLANSPPDKVGQAEAHWEGFRRKYPKAWGRVMLGKVGFNPGHTEALIGVYHGCGLDCSSFETVFLKRIGKKWRVVERVAEEVRRRDPMGNLRYRGPAVALKHRSQLVAIDMAGSPSRAESDDAAKIYGAVLDVLYSSFGHKPRQIVVATTRTYGSPGLPPHRSRIDSSTVAMYDSHYEMRDALYPRFKHRIPIAWISDTSLRLLQGLSRARAELMDEAFDGDSEQLWAAFRSRYPAAWGYARLGRVGFKPDHTQALVLTRHFCGPFCVNTDTWFLERKKEVWYVVERIPHEGQPHLRIDGLRYLGADADPKSYRPRRVRALFTDAKGKALAGHEVEFRRPEEQSMVVKTDANGLFVWKNPPLTGVIMMVKCPSGSVSSSVFAGGFGITLGIDTTLNVRVDFAECSPPPTEPQLAPNAPQDRPVEAAQKCMWMAMDRAMQPYIAKARATWPEARKRYLAGLPPRHTFFVTALLIDDSDRREQVFIAVESIRDGQITGSIWNRIGVVRGYHHGQRYTFPESELRDWMIAKPDGTEEGNFVGKFLDTYEPPRDCASNSVSD